MQKIQIYNAGCEEDDVEIERMQGSFRAARYFPACSTFVGLLLLMRSGMSRASPEVFLDTLS
jgi:hypothetical protein